MLESIRVGFSIRALIAEGLSSDTQKPGTTVVSIDPTISEPHRILLKLGIEHVGYYVNAINNLRFCQHSIMDIYSILDSKDRRKYGIFCYSIVLNKKLSCVEQKYFKIGEEYVGHELFAYAVNNRCEPIGEFLGYDVADCNWVSAITDCDFHWSFVEKFGTLNGSNLFGDVQEAAEFINEADKIVEGHAPFYTWGVYKVKHPHFP